MSEKTPKATHEGILNLKIGETELNCAVLDDGIRIISRNAIFRAFGRTKRGRARYETREPNMPSFLDAKNLKPLINEDLMRGLNQITYTTLSGRQATGYNAEILPLLCDLYLQARSDNLLNKRQLPLAVAAEILVRSLSKIGIIALVDEATGYQEIRDKIALQKILEMYIAKELKPWIKTFPDEFYENLFRLRNWQFRPLSVKRPVVVGKITNDLIYKRLAPGILKELKGITPRDEKGRTKHRYFQRLTENIGHPKLREHLASVTALMKASSTWQIFYRLIQRALPQYGTTLELPLRDIEIEKMDKEIE
ncbi:MAG: P63C domain-containing protein [Proteobacteria bacterium]|nr:P63C domain-containing protein [Pseudomonadota bacterium]